MLPRIDSAGLLTLSMALAVAPALLGQNCIQHGDPPSTTISSGDACYSAGTITINNGFTVNGSGHVIFEATSTIYLQAGFTAQAMESGSWFVGTITVPAATTLSTFQQCIGPGGTGSICLLAPNPNDQNGRYTVTQTLTIGRSNITISGTGGPGDVVLVRGTSSLQEIIQDSAGVTNVVIENLTFDGNRYGFGLPPSGGISCLPWPVPSNQGYPSTFYADLDLTQGGTFTPEWLDFINGPQWDVELSGSLSSISASNFGQGGVGVGPSGGSPAAETGQQSATRHAGIYLGGSSNGAWYNAIAYTGDGAIDMSGSGQYFYGNLVQQARYEMPNLAGGQVFVAPGSSNATVAANVIDGTPGYGQAGGPTVLWSTPSETPLATDCQFQSGTQSPAGIEAYGTGHYFYDNEVENNSGTGMQFAGSDTTNDISISSWNPFYPKDVPRYIEQNGYSGILFLGPYTISNCTTTGGQPGYMSDGVCKLVIAAQGVTLDNPLIRNNANYGVVLDGVSNDTVNENGVFGGYYTGFINNACISGDSIADTGYPKITLAPSNPVSYPTPAYDYYWFARTTSNPNNGTMTSCPASAWPEEPTPPPSNIPGWKW